jgi:hypothetical protein
MKNTMIDKEIEQHFEIKEPNLFDVSLVSDTTLTITNLPKYVGMYEIGKDSGTWFSLFKKPNWFHRTMVRLILGWVWKDINENKK